LQNVKFINRGRNINGWKFYLSKMDGGNSRFILLRRFLKNCWRRFKKIYQSLVLKNLRKFCFILKWRGIKNSLIYKIKRLKYSIIKKNTGINLKFFFELIIGKSIW
jgi:hypothetical protein